VWTWANAAAPTVGGAAIVAAGKKITAAVHMAAIAVAA